MSSSPALPRMPSVPNRGVVGKDLPFPVNLVSVGIDDKSKVTIDDLIKYHNNWLTNYIIK